MVLEIFLNAVSKVINPHLFYLGKRDIHLAIGPHLLDKGSEAVTDVHVLIGLVLVNLSPVFIIDDYAITQVAALHYQHLDALTVIVIGLGLVKEFGKFGTGNDALAGRVKIHANDVASSSLHIHTLLAERYQQVLGHQAPIQEGAHLVHRLDAHEREISDHGFGLFGRRHRAVLTVVIHKHTNHVAHLHLRGEVTFGQ